MNKIITITVFHTRIITVTGKFTPLYWGLGLSMLLPGAITHNPRIDFKSGPFKVLVRFGQEFDDEKE